MQNSNATAQDASNDYSFEILAQHYLTTEELDECKIKLLSHERSKG